MSRKLTPAQAAAQAKMLAARMRTVLVVASEKTAQKALQLARKRTRSVTHPWWGTSGVVDLGNYLNSWRVQKFGDKQFGLVNTARYAEVLENGRSRGARMPPPSALVGWVMRKLGVQAEKARGVAFAVARNIARRGTPPRTVLSGVYSVLANDLKEQVLVETVRLLESSVT